MLNWALRYARLGLSVIPIAERGKSPIIPWKEYQSRRASEEEIRSWYAKTANANIGIVMGTISGVAALDCDGVAGMQKANELKLMSPIVSMSANGGQHRWFKWQDGLASQTLWKGQNPHEEVAIKSDRTLAILPPSVGANGRRYRWLKHFGKNCLPEFPANLISIPTLEVAAFKAKEEGWIAKALQEMKDGNIDNTFVSILGRMRSDGWRADDARALLSPHAIRVGAEEGHLEAKIENIWNRYEPKASIIVNEESETVEEFLKEEEPVKWIVPNLIADNSIGFCVGLPESAKTWLMMDLAISAATETRWCELFAPTKSFKVLFIEQERFRGETKRRFKALLNAKGLNYRGCSNLHIKSDGSLKLDLEQSYNAFVRTLERIRPDMVIIDSLATAHTREENNRMEIQGVMEKVKQLRKQFNCAFFFISHSNKYAFQAAKEGTEPDVSLMAGSIALPAAAETIFMVQKAKGGGSTVSHIKSTLGPKTPDFGIVIEDVSSGIIVRGIK